MTSLDLAIDAATNDFLVAPDFEKNLDICESIKTYSTAQKLVEKAKKTLLQGSARSKSRMLELIQVAMQNNHYVVSSVHEANFQRTLLDLISSGGSLSGEQTDKLLNLIRAWAEAFRTNQKLPNFYETFRVINQRGQSLPPRNDDSFYSPPSFPQPSRSFGDARPGRMNQPNPISPHSISQPATNSFQSKLEEMKNSAVLLLQLMSTIEPRTDNIANNQLINDMFKVCVPFQKEIHIAINTTTNEADLSSLLALNDQITQVQDKYKQLEIDYQNRTSLSAIAPLIEQRKEEEPPKSMFGGLDTPVVLDLGFSSLDSPKDEPISFRQPVSASSSSSAATVPLSKSDVVPQVNAVMDEDFDDMFDSLAMRNDPPASPQQTTSDLLSLPNSSNNSSSTTPQKNEEKGSFVLPFHIQVHSTHPSSFI